jgi:hypothetical protein
MAVAKNAQNYEAKAGFAVTRFFISLQQPP